MLETQQAISEVRDETKALRCELLDRAVGTYAHALGEGSFPSTAVLEAATDRTKSLLKTELMSDAWISACSGGHSPRKEEKTALRLVLGLAVTPLRAPPPQAYDRIQPARVALAALLGAVLGMMLLAPACRLLLDMRDVGLFVGAPAGAFILVLAIWKTSESKAVRGLLMAGLGAATVLELWQILRPRGVFSRVWGRRAGRPSKAGRLGRVAVYLALMLLVAFTRRRPYYGRDQYLQTVRTTIEHWLDGAIGVLVCLLRAEFADASRTKDRKAALRTLGRRIVEIHEATSEALPDAAHELIVEAKNVGFGGLDGEPNFLCAGRQKTTVWTHELAASYAQFGHIEPGDPVLIEHEPVIFDGEVQEKGLVRKLRDRGKSDE